MKKISSPCYNCTQRHTACHDKCEKYQVYTKNNKEIKKRIAEDFKKNDRRSYKPALYQICHKR